MSEVTQELVKELFDYKDGALYWKKSRQGALIGVIAGTPNQKGYLRTMVNGKRYTNHSLIFLYYHGYTPKRIVFFDSNSLNTKIENLRDATYAQSFWNAKLRENNESGIKGVHWSRHTEKWKTCVTANGKQHNLGTYNNKFDAACVVISARNRLHGEFAHR